MSIPLRVKNALFQDAEVEGSLMNRSAAKQVEFWAELGKRVARSVSSADLLALMQGIAEIQVEVRTSELVDPMHVLSSVKQASSNADLGQQITQGKTYFEASVTKNGLLDKVTSDGVRETGCFENGVFVAE